MQLTSILLFSVLIYTTAGSPYKEQPEGRFSRSAEQRVTAEPPKINVRESLPVLETQYGIVEKNVEKEPNVKQEKFEVPPPPATNCDVPFVVKPAKHEQSIPSATNCDVPTNRKSKKHEVAAPPPATNCDVPIPKRNPSATAAKKTPSVRSSITRQRNAEHARQTATNNLHNSPTSRSAIPQKNVQPEESDVIPPATNCDVHIPSVQPADSSKSNSRPKRQC